MEANVIGNMSWIHYSKDDENNKKNNSSHSLSTSPLHDMGLCNLHWLYWFSKLHTKGCMSLLYRQDNWGFETWSDVLTITQDKGGKLRLKVEPALFSGKALRFCLLFLFTLLSLWRRVSFSLKNPSFPCWCFSSKPPTFPFALRPHPKVGPLTEGDIIRWVSQTSNSY